MTSTTLPSGTPAFVSRGDNADRTLVIVPDIWGLRPLFSEMCLELSEQTGWNVVAFEPFPNQDLPGADAPDGLEARSMALTKLHDDALLGDAVAAVALVSDSGDASPPACLIGFCMGGMYAYKAISSGRFQRVVGFYGMIQVPEAWEGAGQIQPLSHIERGVAANVMAIVGTEDAWTPEADVAELEATGATVVRYQDADHGFVHDPSRPAHRADDAADAWERALAFLAG